MHRMVAARATITRELCNLQLAEQIGIIEEIAAPTGENSLTTAYSRPIRHTQLAEYKYLTEEGEVKSITGSSMIEWTSETDARRRAVVEEDASQKVADFETYSRRVYVLSFREQITVHYYEPPSARSFGTSDTPSQLRMS